MSSFKMTRQDARHARYQSLDDEDTDEPDGVHKTASRPVWLSGSNAKHPRWKATLTVTLAVLCVVVLWCLCVPSSWPLSSKSISASLPSLAADPKGRWVDTWTTAPESARVDRVTLPPHDDANPAFANTTIRQTVQIALGGEQIRLQLSNKFGSTDLPITNVTIAMPEARNETFLGSRFIDTATLRTVTFSGDEWLIIPAGALAVSDPISFDRPVDPGEILSISMYLAQGQADTEYITAHVGSQTTAWMNFGDHTRDYAMVDGPGTHDPHWYFINAVEVWKDVKHKAFAIVGDSITNGRGGYINTNHKWPHMLFERMQSRSDLTHISVLNEGAGGNSILEDGKGPSAAARLDRDILTRSGIGYAMVFEGINDIGGAEVTDQEQTEVEMRLIQHYKQIITRVHTFGIPVFGATLTPVYCQNFTRATHYKDPRREQTRLNVNQWVRTSEWFDAVVDFDAAVRDPSNTTEWAPGLDVGDCLHPNERGLRLLAEEFPLEVFAKFEDGVDTFG